MSITMKSLRSAMYGSRVCILCNMYDPKGKKPLKDVNYII